ncbi:hemagglutinin [Diplodia corticola]|uniref:Hemagglutinin n=1 Tax=Diplodia corticola TaxID=236234 RepID=A0A1J9RQJ3_9PEZI|nr:hemagglutinin [Diplodia corticola]OJD29821.1 hemagglutinin [Diplodia corticola]
MKASTIISTIVSMAVVASAVPTADVAVEARTDKTLTGASETCSSNQVVSCCNTSDKTTSTGLLSTIIGSIAGNSCVGVGASVLNLLGASPANGVCGNSNSVKCCSGDKNTGVLVVDLDILSCSDIL